MMKSIIKSCLIASKKLSMNFYGMKKLKLLGIVF